MDKDRLRAILESHGKWLRGEGGKRADLSMANLYGADLCGADLRKADLREANLYGADLCRADLSMADLSMAPLCGANLRETNLRWANLCGADLCGADLYRADLRKADLEGAILSEKIIQIGPIGSRREYTIFWVDRDIVQCGCWNDYEGGSLDEFKKRVNETYPAGNLETSQYRNEYLAAIAMFERLRDDARQLV